MKSRFERRCQRRYDGYAVALASRRAARVPAFSAGTLARILPALLALLAVACGSGGGASGPGLPPGTELHKPGGGTFFLDPHRGGGASRLHLPEITWGRLVDVHQLDAGGEVDPQPVFRDFVVRETVQSDGLDHVLETNAITQRTRLVILRHKGDPDTGSGSFESLLRSAAEGLPPVLPRAEDSPGGTYSLVARNACISLRFDDLLDDGPAARAALRDTLRVLTGYPPAAPFGARLLFDPNHGGLAGGEFHSTRILVDTTVSEEEAAQSEVQMLVNALGFPSSLAFDERANVSLRLPTEEDPLVGQFELLTNLSGAPLDRRSNGPVDLDSPTLDVVRALRAGRGDDGNNGFLLDLNKPEIVGTWPVIIEQAVFDPAGTSGFDLVLDLSFTTPCRRGLAPPDILQAGEFVLEVRQPSGEPNPAGFVQDVRARLLADQPLVTADVLRGGGLYLSTFELGLLVPVACWVDIAPVPGQPPADELDPDSRFVVRFSEPVHPSSVDPFETLRLARGNAEAPLLPDTVVVADVSASADLREFGLSPLLPLAFGASGEFHLDLVGGALGVTDLAGNALAAAPGPIELRLDPLAPAAENGGVVLRFNTTDELEPIGFSDLRGQFFYDLERGTIRGRAATFESHPADRSNPVPGIMIPFLPGVQTPLSGLGSKLQTLWRYCDLGWAVDDESKHNLDVVGIDWAPVGGTVLNDFFERFEMRLAHSRRQPDEFRTFVGTTYPCSGLGAGANMCAPCLTNVLFEDNILRDPRSPQRVVHDRALGYRISVSDLFIGGSGTVLLPFPLNRSGGPFTTFTWRDTSVLAKDGTDSPGIPLLIETGDPLNIVPGPAGRIAPPGSVPAWGLPLLMEFRCFASSSAIGLNPVSIYLAQNAQQLPCFRAYSTGGVNESGVPVVVNPDLALVPEGGFNPGSRPPGQPTTWQADNSFYVGQLETVVRVSRAHTIWMHAGVANPRYLPPVMAPPPEEQPAGARVELEFRGALGFSGGGLSDAFDARKLDPLGDVPGETDVQFLGDDPTWSADPGHVAGASFFQMRLSFVNDLVARVTPELSAVGIAFEAQ